MQLPVADPAVEPELRLASRPVAAPVDIDAVEQPLPGRGIRAELPGEGGTSEPLVKDAQLPAGGRGNLHYREMVRDRPGARYPHRAVQHQRGNRGAVGADRRRRDVGVARGLAEQEAAAVQPAAACRGVQRLHLRGAAAALVGLLAGLAVHLEWLAPFGGERQFLLVTGPGQAADVKAAVP